MSRSVHSLSACCMRTNLPKFVRSLMAVMRRPYSVSHSTSSSRSSGASTSSWQARSSAMLFSTIRVLSRWLVWMARMTLKLDRDEDGKAEHAPCTSPPRSLMTRSTPSTTVTISVTRVRQKMRSRSAVSHASTIAAADSQPDCPTPTSSHSASRASAVSSLSALQKAFETSLKAVTQCREAWQRSWMPVLMITFQELCAENAFAQRLTWSQEQTAGMTITWNSPIRPPVARSALLRSEIESSAPSLHLAAARRESIDELLVSLVFGTAHRTYGNRCRK